MKINNTIGLFCFALIISACGGSGDSSTNSGRPTLGSNTPAPSTGEISPILEDENIEIFGVDQAPVGAAVGFALIAKDNRAINSISWQQIDGPQITILAKHSQTIGFDIPQSGNYTIQANVTLSGQSVPTNYVLNFSASANVSAGAIRLDHTVTELGNVSLHVSAENKEIQSVSWLQVGGPQAQSVEQDNEYLFFDAPAVTQDSVIEYQANIQYTDNSSDSDTVLITVKNVNFNENGLFYGNNIVASEDMFAFNQSSNYKDALENCVYNNIISNPPDCSFQDLPLIGMQTRSPSIQDILDRTLVSHTWMGQRFQEYLEDSVTGSDMLNLLRGVTAIVISYDIRPSFYWVATGAIYLDANYFWQTPSERDTLNDQADYRSGFGSELQFSVFWRYTKDNDYYPKTTIDKDNRINRDFANIEADVSRLLYHELAHANDYMPPSSWASIDSSTTPLAFFRANTSITGSYELNNTLPLRSSEMHALAQVRFKGEASTTAQRNYTGTNIETFFTPDIAASFYSYLSEQEDYATLVEQYMMLYRLNSQADVAIIDGQTANEEPLVIWGQRNRITAPSLQERVSLAVSKVYPELGDINATLRNLPTPILMTPLQGWFENLEISPIQSTKKQNVKTQDRSSIQMDKLIKHDTRHIHQGKPELDLEN